MYKKNSDDWLKHWDFILLDMICLQIAFILAYIVRGYGFWLYEVLVYRNMAVFIEVTDLAILFLLGTMKNVLKRGYYVEFNLTVRQGVVVGATSIFYLFITQQGQLYSRAMLVFTVIFYITISYVTRVSWKAYLKKKKRIGEEKSLLIIATKDQVNQVVEDMEEQRRFGYYISGIVILGDNMKGEAIHGIDVVSTTENAAEYVCKNWVDEVLIVIEDNALYPEKLVEQLSETGVIVHINLAKISEILGKKQFVEQIGNYTVLTTSINYASSKQLLCKRLIDIVGGIVGCLITGIFFVLFAPVIYVASPGPIFFAQDRVGKNGKLFKMYKFRSMYLDAEERKAALMKDNKLGDGKMFKLDFDPRVIGNKVLADGTKKTGIGDFLRRTSIDEFPQFYNVLKGDMSIVGTRPPLISETNLYELHHKARLAIKPGITGLWQVSGRSEIIDFEEVVRLDREYIEKWNIGLDIKILLKTIVSVLRRNGAV